MNERLSQDLLDLLGEAAFVVFTQAFGGTRLYVPPKIAADHEIVATIGVEAAGRLQRRYSPAVIRVPLAREVRARFYRGQNKTNTQIARLLGITETGVDKLFARISNPPAKGSLLPLFPDA